MKIRANISLDIDLTPDDIIAGMQDQDFEEFRVKLNKVAGEYHKEQELATNKPVNVVSRTGKEVKLGQGAFDKITVPEVKQADLTISADEINEATQMAGMEVKAALVPEYGFFLHDTSRENLINRKDESIDVVQVNSYDGQIVFHGTLEECGRQYPEVHKVSGPYFYSEEVKAEIYKLEKPRKKMTYADINKYK